MHAKPKFALEPDLQEIAEWIEAFDQVVDQDGTAQGARLLEAFPAERVNLALMRRYSSIRPTSTRSLSAKKFRIPAIAPLKARIKSLVRWNAMAMVHRQNKKDPGIGGHISTFSSLATLLEVGFNHFFHASTVTSPETSFISRDTHHPAFTPVRFWKAASAWSSSTTFAMNCGTQPGLSSYPHPWLMSNFWSFPTVSMGLGPISAVYQARFMRYLENRGLIKKTPRKVWAFIGDGETDEPEALGSITLASREKLDNLIFVVNCNLQRLDGPVRGNGKIIQELEAAFKGAGWNVIKVVWGSSWDPLLARDKTGMLVKRMEECVDGEYQAFKAKDGAFVRKEFFGKYPESAKLVENMTDDEIWHLQRGGHDPQKVYNAYYRATLHTGAPTVILAKTIKGYGLSTSQARNATHQEKKMTDEAMVAFRKRFDIPIPDAEAKDALHYRPPDDSPELKYLHARRKELGGYMPARNHAPPKLETPPLEFFAESLAGSKGRAVSTTMGYVSMLRTLLKHPTIGKLVVPIVPDEARTFGMESIFRQVGIYASQGQLYKPHDQDMLLYYREEKDGQILEEGITEAGSMCSLTAAGTAYANYRVPMIPFFIYYSMFGFQRIGDLAWAFADARGKGFLLGGTAGRTTSGG